jgi:hypothetical protein
VKIYWQLYISLYSDFILDSDDKTNIVLSALPILLTFMISSNKSTSPHGQQMDVFNFNPSDFLGPTAYHAAQLESNGDKAYPSIVNTVPLIANNLRSSALTGLSWYW